MADAKANKTAEPEQDQSMEEILQSIRRIIAEESDDAPAAAPAEGVKGSDVLELTDMVQDDGSVEAVTAPAPASGDVLSTIDAALAPAPVAAAPKPQPKPAVEEKPTLVATPDPAPTIEVPVNTPKDEPLVSPQASNASASVIKSMADTIERNAARPTPSAGFRSGTSVEELTMEALRPMLKEWLDENLTGIVERIVERELRRITTSSLSE